jgi:hypothetical protein
MSETPRSQAVPVLHFGAWVRDMLFYVFSTRSFGATEVQQVSRPWCASEWSIDRDAKSGGERICAAP